MRKEKAASTKLEKYTNQDIGHCLQFVIFASKHIIWVLTGIVIMWVRQFQLVYTWCVLVHIKKTCLFKNIHNFTAKIQKFSIKTLIFFFISAKNIDCGNSLELPQRGGSNQYPQFMILSRNKENNVYPVNPSFTIQKLGLREVKIR